MRWRIAATLGVAAAIMVAVGPPVAADTTTAGSSGPGSSSSAPTDTSPPSAATPATTPVVPSQPTAAPPAPTGSTSPARTTTPARTTRPAGPAAPTTPPRATAPTGAPVTPVAPLPLPTIDPRDRAAVAAASAAVLAAANAAKVARSKATTAAVAAGRAAATAQAARERAGAAQGSLHDAQAVITSAVRAAYRAGPVSEFGLLTSSDDPREVLQGSYVEDVVARTAATRLAGAQQQVSEAENARVQAEATSRFAAQVAAQAVAAAKAAAAAEDLARAKAAALDRAIARRLLGAAGLLPSAEQTPALMAAASAVKDVTPFAPTSGPNSNDRMAEWLASDRTVVAGTPRAYAVTQLRRFNWGLSEWGCLDRMWWHESGWSPYSVDHAQGGTDGVLDTAKTWGIPQAFPASKMGDVTAGGGPDWVTNPATQVNWGLTYIARRYASPCLAWASWRAIAATGRAGWY